MQGALIIAAGILTFIVWAYIIWRIALEPALEWALQKYAASRVAKEHPEWMI